MSEGEKAEINNTGRSRTAPIGWNCGRQNRAIVCALRAGEQIRCTETFSGIGSVRHQNKEDVK